MAPSWTLQPCKPPVQPSRLLPSSRRTKPGSVLNSSARAGAAVRQTSASSPSRHTLFLKQFIGIPPYIETIVTETLFIFSVAETDQVRKGADVEQSACNGRRTVASLVQSVPRRQLEALRRGQNHHVALARHVVDVPAGADRRAVVAAGDALAPVDLSRPHVGAGYRAVVAPQEEQVVLDQRRGAERDAARDAVDFLRLLGAGADCHHFLTHSHPAARSQHEIARHDRRADARLDVTLVEEVGLPVLATRLRVNARDAVAPVGEDQFGRAVLRLENAGRCVRRLALARHLPAHLAAGRVKGDQRARSVLVVGDDHQSVVDDWRCAETVPRPIRPQVGAPDLLATVVEGDDEIILRPAPADVKVPLGHGGRRRGEAVVRVLAVALAGKLARPQLAPVLCRQAQDGAPARLLVGGGDEDTLAPQDRAGVPGAW